MAIAPFWLSADDVKSVEENVNENVNIVRIKDNLP